MKKIITLFVFIFALSFNANAQEAKTANELGKADAKAVAELVKIDSQTVTALEGLFEMKHQTLLTVNYGGKPHTQNVNRRCCAHNTPVPTLIFAYKPLRTT